MSANTKICTACNEEKPLEQFPPRKDAPNATHRSRCKACHYRINSSKYPETLKAAQKAWIERNRERVNACARERRKRNPAAFKLAADKWRNKNKHVHAERVRRRDAKKKMATPSWADRNAILEFYLKARTMSEETGIRYQVDHIIPLVSKLVCGLHVEHNLQILTINENSRKQGTFTC